jgi:hypothetical protein
MDGGVEMEECFEVSWIFLWMLQSELTKNGKI